MGTWICTRNILYRGASPMLFWIEQNRGYTASTSFLASFLAKITKETALVLKKGWLSLPLTTASFYYYPITFTTRNHDSNLHSNKKAFTEINTPLCIGIAMSALCLKNCLYGVAWLSFVYTFGLQKCVVRAKVTGVEKVTWDLVLWQFPSSFFWVASIPLFDRWFVVFFHWPGGLSLLLHSWYYNQNCKQTWQDFLNSNGYANILSDRIIFW